MFMFPFFLLSDFSFWSLAANKADQQLSGQLLDMHVSHSSFDFI